MKEQDYPPVAYGVEGWTTFDWLDCFAGLKQLPPVAAQMVNYLRHEADARRAVMTAEKAKEYLINLTRRESDA